MMSIYKFIEKTSHLLKIKLYSIQPINSNKNQMITSMEMENGFRVILIGFLWKSKLILRI